MIGRLYLWFLAYFRLSNSAVCEMSIGRGLRDDYHDYHDDIEGRPVHSMVLRCKRCGKSFIIALLLAFVLAMPIQAQVTVYAPAMPIHRVSLGLLRADKEDCIAVAKIGGKIVTIPCSIDPTYIRGIGTTKWVDACVCAGMSLEGHAIHLNLPKERVDATLLRGSVARAMISPGWITDSQTGDSRDVYIYWPACHASKVGRNSFLAEAVTAYEVSLP